jgi:hypothetical protein
MTDTEFRASIEAIKLNVDCFLYGTESHEPGTIAFLESNEELWAALKAAGRSEAATKLLVDEAAKEIDDTFQRQIDAVMDRE